MKTVRSAENGVLSSKFPEKMAKNSDKIALSVKWARNILKSMNLMNEEIQLQK